MGEQKAVIIHDYRDIDFFCYLIGQDNSVIYFLDAGGKIIKLIEGLARIMGKLISMLYESRKESVDVVLRSVIPFMAFVSVIITVILSSGIGKIMANTLSPLAGSLWGLLIISFLCGISFLSPLLGPGAAIAQVIGVLIGAEIGLGHIPPQYALPALFAINVQVGADFVPVFFGYSLL